MADISNSKLMQTGAEILSLQEVCVVIVKTEWNAEIVDSLEEGCRNLLVKSSIRDICTIIVPGAIEIPFAIKSFWESHKYKDNRPHVFIALGCVIRGGTPHFDYVCQSVTIGITQLNLSIPVPVIFGVLTVDSQQQAEERIGGIHGHKGEEAAITSLKMVALARSFHVNRKTLE